MEWEQIFKGFEFTAAHGSLPVERQGIRLAGAMVGSRAYYEARLVEKWPSMEKALALVEEHAKPQEAMVMIRQSIVAKMDFQRRMLPADVMGQMAEKIDEEVVRAVQRIAGASAETDWGEDPIIKLWIAQGKGLPGIRKLGKTAEAAAIASFLAAARNIPGLKIPGSVMHSIMVYNQRVRANKLQTPGSTAELLKATETWRRPQKKADATDCRRGGKRASESARRGGQDQDGRDAGKKNGNVDEEH